MSSTPQFELYSHLGGPNGWIAFVLEALGLTYKTHFLDFNKTEQKAEAYTKLNPNGRVPALVDHATGLTLWESNAIMKYLVTKYDKEGRFAVTGDDIFKLDQWLYFQASGQGPYFGQAAWFTLFAPEKIPYAMTRYRTEVGRICTVLDTVLAKQAYLVGNKVTIADMSFVTWNEFAFNALLPEDKKPEDYPHLYKWHKQMLELPYVKTVLAEKARLSQ